MVRSKNGPAPKSNVLETLGARTSETDTAARAEPPVQRRGILRNRACGRPADIYPHGPAPAVLPLQLRGTNAGKRTTSMGRKLWELAQEAQGAGPAQHTATTLAQFAKPGSRTTRKSAGSQRKNTKMGDKLPHGPDARSPVPAVPHARRMCQGPQPAEGGVASEPDDIHSPRGSPRNTTKAHKMHASGRQEPRHTPHTREAPQTSGAHKSRNPKWCLKVCPRRTGFGSFPRPSDSRPRNVITPVAEVFVSEKEIRDAVTIVEEAPLDVGEDCAHHSRGKRERESTAFLTILSEHARDEQSPGMQSCRGDALDRFASTHGDAERFLQHSLGQSRYIHIYRLQ